MEAVYQRYGDRRRTSLRQRIVSLVLAIGLQLLVVLALLKLDGRLTQKPEIDHPLSTFSLLPAATPARTAVARPKTIAKTKPSARSAAPPSVTPPHPTEAKQPPLPVNPLFGNKALFDGGNIAALPSHDEDQAASNKGDTGTESASTYGPGEGPGGQRLYKASWRRLPTDDELAFYLPHNLPDHATANIMCIMLPDYHVENCRALDETPPGTGLARGLREAAWQFRINPPRVGGKMLLGKWVIIHFDWSTIRRDASQG